MATQITQQLPPGYVTAIGENFSQYFQGNNPITGSPFYADPNQMYGNEANNYFVAAQDALTTGAQGIAQGTQAAPTGGLGQYQDYLTDANTLGGSAQGLLNTNIGAGSTSLQNAADTANLGSLAAISGQGAADPYMAAASTGLTGAGQTTQGALSYQGPDAYQQFMSPYQQQVMDATMAEYDNQAAIQQSQLGASAGNAYGGSRVGVAQSQLASDSSRNRAMLQASLLNQGYMQSQGLANQAFQNQLGMGAQQAGQAGQQLGIGSQAMNQATGNVGLYGTAGAAQQGVSGAQQGQLANQLGMYNQQANQAMGVGQYGLTGLGNLLDTYTTMGQQNTIYNQAGLDQQQAIAQGLQLAPAQTMGNLGQYLSAAYGTPSSTVYQQTPDPSTLQTLLGAGLGLGGIMGSLGRG
jgi:hypothetical protein